MTKQVVCPVCNGYGFTSAIGENYSCSHTCDHCNGAGEIEIPMTNADRIRAMSDEELAASPLIIPCFYDDDGYGECKFGWHNRTQSCEECRLEWLKQPAEE